MRIYWVCRSRDMVSQHAFPSPFSPEPYNPAHARRRRPKLPRKGPSGLLRRRAHTPRLDPHRTRAHGLRIRHRPLRPLPPPDAGRSDQPSGPQFLGIAACRSHTYRPRCARQPHWLVSVCAHYPSAQRRRLDPGPPLTYRHRARHPPRYPGSINGRLPALPSLDSLTPDGRHRLNPRRAHRRQQRCRTRHHSQRSH
jgi:hypothetical protein